MSRCSTRPPDGAATSPSTPSSRAPRARRRCCRPLRTPTRWWPSATPCRRRCTCGWAVRRRPGGLRARRRPAAARGRVPRARARAAGHLRAGQLGLLPRHPLQRRHVGPPEPLWADARPACGTCPWAPVCETGREDARDLSLVAGIRRDQVHRLRERGAATVEALAVAGEDQRPPSMSRPTFERLRAQAALQARGDAQPPGSPPLHVVHDDAPLRLLPEPDAGDLYYDIEGDPFADGGEGLEYLHGLTGADGRFTAHWAHDRAQERVAFEAVVDTMTAAAAAHPGMHVYHYAAYERTALLALGGAPPDPRGRVDQLLREGRLVDLYAVVRSSVRVSAPSYSIKKLEPLYMGSDLRSSDVKTAGDSIVQYEHYAALTARGFHDDAAVVLEAIRDYNAYDCESTRRLHDWLLALVGRTTAAAAEAAAAAARAAAEQAVHDSADPLALAAAVGVDDVAGSADGSAVDGPDAVVKGPRRAPARRRPRPRRRADRPPARPRAAGGVARLLPARAQAVLVGALRQAPHTSGRARPRRRRGRARQGGRERLGEAAARPHAQADRHRDDVLRGR
ncbi:MAG: TM0106 family RecB-like putative nuclease [Quadrisphaera sp.]